MSKAEKLQNHLKSADEPKKWKAYAIVAVGVLIAVGLLFGLIWFADVDNYIEHNKLPISLYKFYDEKVGCNETAVFFIGSSVIGLTVYPPDINAILESKGYDIKTYNLIVEGDFPLERTLDIQKIIDAKPSLVIYGVTYRSITDKSDDWYSSEKIKLIHGMINLRDDAKYLFSENELNDFNSNPDFFYIHGKTFLKGALDYKLSGKSRFTYDYFTDPYGESFRRYHETTKDYESILRQSYNPNDDWRPIITNESTRFKEAFIYNVQTLQKSGIPVVIINMPIHPLFSAQITDESRQNFFEILDQTGAKWYDMEKDYDDTFFTDSHHAKFEDGALVFSPRITDLIIQELT